MCENLDKISVAIIGATGAVGQRFVQLLNGHPWFDLEVLAASDKSEGKRYDEAVNWCLTEPLPEKAADKPVMKISSDVLKAEGVKLVFSALPAEVAMGVESNLAADGFFVFSNASAHRMDTLVPLLIADINPEHIALVEHQKKSTPGFIVANPNCSVAGLATGLKPLNVEFGIKNVVVTTYQALSGAGYPGVPANDIVGNVLPYIANEEDKVVEECNKILGTMAENGIEKAKFDVLANCARVNVRDGHLEAVVVELNEMPKIEKIKEVFSKYNGLGTRKLPSAPENPIIIKDAENRPQPKLDIYSGTPERASGMAVTIGRINIINNKLRFFLLVHNTIRGAAGCSIMNAELAKLDGYIN